jgi:hypothetical protein
MMNKKIILFSIFTVMVAFTLSLGSTVFAKSNYVNNLKSKIDETSTKNLNNSIGKIYKNNVAPSLISHRQDLVYSNVSDQAITDATLSAPMPIFSSNEKYKKGEDFKSKLKLSGWQFIAYADGKPITVFSVDKQNGEYIVTNVINENFAKAFSDAIMQLNVNTPVVLPVGGYFFIADTNDNIALAKPQNGTNVKYDVKTYDELNKAANKSIDYYSSQTEMADGGSVVLDYLYGNSTANSSSSTTYAIVFAIGVACLVSAVILFRNRKLKLKSN